MRVSDSDIMERVLERLPPGWKPAALPIVDYLYSVIAGGQSPASNVQRFSLLYYQALRLARSKDLETVLTTFESDLQLLIAEFARKRIFVHAGVVGLKNQAVVIPGLSLSGKTTLVSKLVEAGAKYYSDEYAVLDEHGRVHPFARPLGVRRPNELETTRIDVASLGGVAGSRPLPVRLVISTKFQPGATWRPRQLTRGRGVLELLANTVSARSQTRLAFSTLPRAIESAEVLKGVRGEADEIVEKILTKVA